MLWAISAALLKLHCQWKGYTSYAFARRVNHTNVARCTWQTSGSARCAGTSIGAVILDETYSGMLAGIARMPRRHIDAL